LNWPPERALWVFGVLVFAALAVAFYPTAIGIKDESVYLTEPYIFRAGTVFADVAHVSVIFAALNGRHVLPVYPPGVGALLLPATLITWRAAFAVPLLLQLAGFLLFRVLLGQLGIRRGWAVLYLFYPSLVLFSRTLMSEVPSATLLLLALVLYTRGTLRSRIAAGVALGALGFIRYANPITAALFLAAALLRDIAENRVGDIMRRPLRVLPRAVPLLCGFVLTTALLIVYDLHAYGGPLGPEVGTFGLRYLPGHVLEYAGVLVLIWPLMLFAPLLYRGLLRVEASVTTYGTLLVMSAWYYAEDTHGFGENMLTIPRLLLPAIPLWLVAYAGVLDRAARIERTYWRAVRAVAAIGAIGMIGISIAHERYLDQAATARTFVDRRITAGSVPVVNDETGILVGPAFGVPLFLREGPGPIPQLACPGAPPVTVVYTAKGDPDDRLSLARTLRMVAFLRARPVVYRKINTWSAAIWQRGRC